MKARTSDALEQIEEDHDWQCGNTHTSGGLHYYGTDQCRYCGLIRKWEHDEQNHIPLTYRFQQNEDAPNISIRDVLELGCQ